MVSTVQGAFRAVEGLFEKIGDAISSTSAVGKFAVDVAKVVADMGAVEKEVKKTVKNVKKAVKKKK